MSEVTCDHDFDRRQNFIADGFCPLCAETRIQELEAQLTIAGRDAGMQATLWKARAEKAESERDEWKARYEKAITERGVLFTRDAIEAKTIERCAQVVETMPIQIYRDGPTAAERSCKPATFEDAAEAIRALKPSEERNG